MRNLEDIKNMSSGDYGCGIVAHYKPLAELVKSRGYKTGIEIGCAYGNNAEYLLQHTDLEFLICIDPYKFYTAMPGFTEQAEYDTLYKFTRDKLAAYKERVILYRTTSKEAFDDGLLDAVDFCFIDGSHEYADVKQECETYSKLLNPNGQLLGHDYNIFESVNKAIDEYAASVSKTVKVLDGNIWCIG